MGLLAGYCPNGSTEKHEGLQLSLLASTLACWGFVSRVYLARFLEMRAAPSKVGWMPSLLIRQPLPQNVRQLSTKTTLFAGHHLDSQRMSDDMRPNISSHCSNWGGVQRKFLRLLLRFALTSRETQAKVIGSTLDHTAGLSDWHHWQPENFQKHAKHNKSTKEMSCINDRKCIHLPHLSAISTNDPSVQHHYSHRGFGDVSEEPRGELESRFSDVNEQKQIFNFTKNPSHVDASSLPPTITQLYPSYHCRQTTFLKLNSRQVGHPCSLVSEADCPTWTTYSKSDVFLAGIYTSESTRAVHEYYQEKAEKLAHKCTSEMPGKDCSNKKYNMKKVEEKHGTHASTKASLVLIRIILAAVYFLCCGMTN